MRVRGERGGGRGGSGDGGEGRDGGVNTKRTKSRKIRGHRTTGGLLHQQKRSKHTYMYMCNVMCIHSQVHCVCDNSDQRL